MSLKLSPGCKCCDADGVCESVCSDGSMQNEYDVTFAGWSDNSPCVPFGTPPEAGVCDAFTGKFGYATSSVPFTLGGGTPVVRSEGAWWQSAPFSDGWVGVPTSYSSPAADVPSGATGACVWSYFFPDRNSVYCTWVDWTGEVHAYLYFEGYSLCKFRISDTEFIWRLYVFYKWELNCSVSDSPPVSDTDQLTSDWWWQYTSTNNNCSLDGSETWTEHTPSSFDLSVDCSASSFAMQTYPYTKSLSDFCSSALSLTSVVDG